MLNQVTLIGRVVETPALRKYETEHIATTLVLAVTRPYKNMEGSYDTDFIRITLWNGVAQNACDYLQKGDIVGVKGRVAIKDTEIHFSKEEEDLKKKISIIEVIGERICFIHSNRKKTELQNIENNVTYNY